MLGAMAFQFPLQNGTLATRVRHAYKGPVISKKEIECTRAIQVLSTIGDTLQQKHEEFLRNYHNSIALGYPARFHIITTGRQVGKSTSLGHGYRILPEKLDSNYQWINPLISSLTSSCKSTSSVYTVRARKLLYASCSCTVSAAASHYQPLPEPKQEASRIQPWFRRP